MIDDNVKDQLWDNEFSTHPNIKKNKEEIAVYQLTKINTPHYVDYGGNLNYLNSR